MTSAASAEPALTLRERKKQRTRRALIDASQRLFMARGFANTTLEQVAAEVDVHVTTLLRYFPTKQDLALALEQQAFERFRAGVTDPARSEPALDYYLDFIDRLARDWVADPQRLNYAFFLDSEPLIVAQSTRILRDYEDALAEALARDDDIDPWRDYYSHVVAAMAVNSVHALVRRWHRAPDEVDLVRSLMGLRSFCHEQFPSRGQARKLRLVSRKARR